MIPDTDEQLIAEATEILGIPNIYGNSIFLSGGQLRAIINHYIALDRAQLADELIVGYKQDAERFRWLENNVCQVPVMTNQSNGNMKWQIRPYLVCRVSSDVSFSEAVDMAINASIRSRTHSMILP